MVWQAVVARQIEADARRIRLRAVTIASERRHRLGQAAALHGQVMLLSSVRPGKFAGEQVLAFVPELLQAGTGDLALTSLSVLIPSLNVSHPGAQPVSLLAADLRELALWRTARGYLLSAQGAGRLADELQLVDAVGAAPLASAPDLP